MYTSEKLVLIQNMNDLSDLSWHVCFVDFIEYAIDWLKLESDLDGNYRAISLLESGDYFRGGLDY